jgi:hypothetical protein
MQGRREEGIGQGEGFKVASWQCSTSRKEGRKELATGLDARW